MCRERKRSLADSVEDELLAGGKPEEFKRGTSYLLESMN